MSVVEIVAKDAGKHPHARTRWLDHESADAKTKVYHLYAFLISSR